MIKTNKGFTLIELLVVIAIIGILSSVVLASLNTARNKGADAAIKSQMGSVRAQAEIFYDTGNTYSGACASTNMLLQLNGAKSANGTSLTTVTALATAGQALTVTCHDSATAWAAEAPLKASTTGTPSMWCADSTGASKIETAVLAANATVCA